MTGSIDFLHQGTSSAFVDSLCMEIMNHSAVNHPFLEKLGNGEFENTTAVLRDYAYQYSIYSEWFTKYLDGVISNLADKRHIDALMEKYGRRKRYTPTARISLNDPMSNCSAFLNRKSA